MNENLSQLLARILLDEKQGRSISKMIADNTGASMNTVHLVMALGVLGAGIAYLDSK